MPEPTNVSPVTIRPAPFFSQPPAAVFWASQLMFGIAAGLLVMALAGFFAIPELTQYYSQLAFTASASQVRLLGFGLIGLAILMDLVVGWLAVAVTRGRPRTRLFTWIACGVTACGAIAVLVLRPWAAVPWLPVVLQIAAAAVGMLSVAAAVLLAQPLSGKFFESSRGTNRADQGQPPTTVQPDLGAPAGLASAAATAPAAPADYDPFS
jgi:hypothetical protein